MSIPHTVVDMHAHVAVKGDGAWARYGGLSQKYQSRLMYRIFLCLAGLQRTPLETPHISDDILFDHLVTQITGSAMPKVVCLALDCYVDPVTHQERKDLSHFWVANDYITDKLRPAVGDQLLFGASVNPNRTTDDFQTRVKQCVDRGAVLLKWIPSAHGIDLADDHVADAIKFLTTAGPGGKPLPLLLHIGPEPAFPPPEGHDWMETYNFLSWSDADEHHFRKFGDLLHRPAVTKICSNLEAALNAGATIIFAHCGLRYYSNDHNDFNTVRDFLTRTARGEFAGKACADISSCATPWRKCHFDELRALPPDLLLYGSDFPTPTFDLSPDSWGEFVHDLEDVILHGQLSRIVVPDGNPLDVAYSEMTKIFGSAHPLFSNFSRLLGNLAPPL